MFPLWCCENHVNPSHLCNGTRCIVQRMYNCIEVTITTGPSTGQDNYIFQGSFWYHPIQTYPLNSRLQFPLRICFAMSISKAQGQSVKVAGLYLQMPCFSHGKFYVACSRVGSLKFFSFMRLVGRQEMSFTMKPFRTFTTAVNPLTWTLFLINTNPCGYVYIYILHACFTAANCSCASLLMWLLYHVPFHF